MSQVTLESGEISDALLSLMTRLAEAIRWVQRDPRRIPIKVPDELGRTGFFIQCLSPVMPPERGEAEVLLGVLQEMKKKTPRRPGTRPRK